MHAPELVDAIKELESFLVGRGHSVECLHEDVRLCGSFEVGKSVNVAYSLVPSGQSQGPGLVGHFGPKHALSLVLAFFQYVISPWADFNISSVLSTSLSQITERRGKQSGLYA